MKLFVDRTGRPGPAFWQDGTFPEHESDYPVTGVSWFEAAAYAEFAGKRLPSFLHWRNVQPLWQAEHILPLSNFGTGLAPVGRYQGIAWHGAYDLAGNAREWVWNETADGQRHILGGAVGDPDYMFTNLDRRPPFDRSRGNGFRCMKFITAPEANQLAEWDKPRPPPSKPRDFAQEKPVSDEEFEVIRRRFGYAAKDLESRVESTDDTDPRWRRETVSFATAYGRERMTAFIFLPRQVRPPYQAIVYFPGSGAQYPRSSELLSDMPRISALAATRRAVVYPIYEGTYERRRAGTAARTPVEVVEWRIHLVQDVSRTIDYLETRSDFIRGKVALSGFSWGATLGVLASAIEPRIKANVLAAGGLSNTRFEPEADPFNYAPRVKTPTLMLNGRDDFVFPVETLQRPLFNALGTAPEHKRHVLFDGGHALTLPQVDVEITDWLDRYLGPVK